MYYRAPRYYFPNSEGPKDIQATATFQARISRHPVDVHVDVGEREREELEERS